MKNYIGYLVGALTLLIASSGYAFVAGTPVPSDSRIKTYVYNDNDVYRVLTHFGYQMNIQLADDEEIETISLGDRSGWQVTPAGNRVFIRAMMDESHTNMTIITDRRSYQFDLYSAEPGKQGWDELVYVVKFFYPPKNPKQTIAAPAMQPNGNNAMPAMPMAYNQPMPPMQNYSPMPAMPPQNFSSAPQPPMNMNRPDMSQGYAQQPPEQRQYTGPMVSTVIMQPLKNAKPLEDRYPEDSYTQPKMAPIVYYPDLNDEQIRRIPAYYDEQNAPQDSLSLPSHTLNDYIAF